MAAAIFFTSLPEDLPARRRRRLFSGMAADMFEVENEVVKAVVRREVEYLVMICMSEN